MTVAGNLTFRNVDPEQLDRMIRVVGPTGWAVLAVLLSVLAGGLVWSILSTATVKVVGRGVLQADGGLTQLVAPDAGTVAALPVGVGQHVAAGDLLVRLSQPSLAARLDTLRGRVASLRAERDRLADFSDRERGVRGVADTQRLAGLDTSLKALLAQEKALTESLVSQRTLQERGFASRDRVLALEVDLADVRRQIATTRDSFQALGVDANDRRVQSERSLMEAENRISAAVQELAEAETDYAARTELRAPAAGRVVELAVAPGDRVVGGVALMRVAGEDGAGLSALIYVSPAEGKKIRPGMDVQLVPSTVRMEREGFIRAEVVSVSEIPATRDAMLRRLANATLVDTLLTDGPPFELRVRLRTDPATVSGFAWSSDLGGTRVVESGTVVQAHVVVDRVRLIGLVFPQVDTLLHWLGFDA